MPWISRELCTGCERCIDECSSGAISMDVDVAFIDDEKCIRCGVCHEVCSDDAVRHDGERVPEEVESNMAWVRQLLEHEYYLNDSKKQKALIERLLRYFASKKKATEKTIECLEVLQNTAYSN
jgi:ferredoxin